MKKRIICVLFLSLTVMIFGCAKSEETDNNVQTKDNTVQQESNKEKGDEEKEVKQEEKDTDTLEEKKIWKYQNTKLIFTIAMMMRQDLPVRQLRWMKLL